MLNTDKILSAVIKISNCIIKTLKKEFTEKRQDERGGESNSGDGRPVRY
jgi:hypothetical protein